MLTPSLAAAAAAVAALLRQQQRDGHLTHLPLPLPSLRPQASATPAAPAAPHASPALGVAAAARQWQGCRRCGLSRGRTSVVFGTGPQGAPLMVVGAAPGRDEDLQGRPFVDAAGALLDRMLAAMRLTRDRVYLTTLVKCRPPAGRPPEAAEVTACAPALRAQIAAVRPAVLLALGEAAAQGLTGGAAPRGVWTEALGVPLMPTLCLTQLLRCPADKRLAWKDLQAVIARLPGLTSGAETVQ